MMSYVCSAFLPETRQYYRQQEGIYRKAWLGLQVRVT